MALIGYLYATLTRRNVALLVILAMAITATLVVFGLNEVALAHHERSNGGTGFVCPHCSSWNWVCRFANWVDRCRYWR